MEAPNVKLSVLDPYGKLFRTSKWVYFTLENGVLTGEDEVAWGRLNPEGRSRYYDEEAVAAVNEGWRD